MITFQGDGNSQVLVGEIVIVKDEHLQCGNYDCTRNHEGTRLSDKSSCSQDCLPGLTTFNIKNTYIVPAPAGNPLQHNPY